MIALLKTAERTNNLSYFNNYVYQRHLFAYAEAAQEPLSGQQVLELGCGEGYGMKMLSPQTAYYLAVDKKKPDDRFFNDNIGFRHCRLPHLSGIDDRSFDMVICFQVIEHIRNDTALLREIKRVLRPGGKLLLTTPNKLSSLSRNPFHIREYLPQEMDRLLTSAGFSGFTIRGVQGNQQVMEYYRENKRSVNALTKWDIFRLQYRLPAPLLKLPYTLFNNINRLALLKRAADTTVNIRYQDFYLDDQLWDCLDYFVTAWK
jgi:ubiquinone/menaquinone biosynthesis C-methylase UbiE